MREKIYFSEWTEKELLSKARCRCDCHTYPGVYPTSEDRPCHVCGHVNTWGYFPDSNQNRGWVEYWRSDKAGIYAD